MTRGQYPISVPKQTKRKVAAVPMPLMRRSGMKSRRMKLSGRLPSSITATATCIQKYLMPTVTFSKIPTGSTSARSCVSRERQPPDERRSHASTRLRFYRHDFGRCIAGGLRQRRQGTCGDSPQGGGGGDQYRQDRGKQIHA